MQLSDIVRDTRKLVVHFDNGDLNITYRPSSYTAEVESQVMDGLNTRPVGTLCKMLAPMLMEWDLMDGDKPLAISEKTLDKLPGQFLITILQAIMEDMRPNPQKQPA